MFRYDDYDYEDEAEIRCAERDDHKYLVQNIDHMNLEEIYSRVKSLKAIKVPGCYQFLNENEQKHYGVPVDNNRNLKDKIFEHATLLDKDKAALLVLLDHCGNYRVCSNYFINKILDKPDYLPLLSRKISTSLISNNAADTLLYLTAYFRLVVKDDNQKLALYSSLYESHLSLTKINIDVTKLFFENLNQHASITQLNNIIKSHLRLHESDGLNLFRRMAKKHILTLGPSQDNPLDSEGQTLLQSSQSFLHRLSWKNSAADIFKNLQIADPDKSASNQKQRINKINELSNKIEELETKILNRKPGGCLGPNLYLDFSYYEPSTSPKLR